MHPVLLLTFQNEKGTGNHTFGAIFVVHKRPRTDKELAYRVNESALWYRSKRELDTPLTAMHILMRVGLGAIHKVRMLSIDRF